MSYGYLPYITLPSRITEYSATCIDHIFIRYAKNSRSQPTNTLSGMFYCDITDHLRCFVSLKCNLCVDNVNRPKARLFGDKNCRKFKELMEYYDWNALYLSSPYLYRSFISVVKRFYEISFPMVTLSRSRMREKPWVTKGLKTSIKNINFINHKLYKLYIRSGDEQTKINIADIRICFEFVLGRLKTNIIRIYSKIQGRLHTTSGKILDPL